MTSYPSAEQYSTVVSISGSTLIARGNLISGNTLIARGNLITGAQLSPGVTSSEEHTYRQGQPHQRSTLIARGNLISVVTSSQEMSDQLSMLTLNCTEYLDAQRDPLLGSVTSIESAFMIVFCRDIHLPASAQRGSRHTHTHTPLKHNTHTLTHTHTHTQFNAPEKLKHPYDVHMTSMDYLGAKCLPGVT